jgi:integrase
MIERRQRKRRDGSAYTVWRVRWYDTTGAERSRTFDRAADARAFEAKVRTLKRGDNLAELDAGRETLADFAAEWWEHYAVGNLARNTLKGYATSWNTHVLPRLGGYRLRDLSPQIIVAFRTDLEAEGVGVDAIRKALAMLQGILQRAVEWERIQGNPVKAVRKPRPARRRAVSPLPPTAVEAVRSVLLEDGRLADATLVSVLAYAGLRPQEALALQWRHVRRRTLLVEQALVDGQLKGQKTNRPPRTVELLSELARDLAEWSLAGGRPGPDAYVFPASGGGPWQDHDWRNWRKRVYIPAAQAAGLESPRPYDLRHSFASLLIHEGRHSVVDIAAQLGHDATMTLSTYAHVVAELRDAPKLGADEQIRAARRSLMSTECGPNTAHEPIPGQMAMFELPSEQQKAPQMRGFGGEPTGGLEPPTPSLRVMCSTS